jgi:hypothetical protein
VHFHGVLLKAADDELRYRSEAEPKRSWLVRFIWIGSLLLIVAVAGLVVRWKIEESGARKDLDAIIAELDESDPYWRIEDIEAHRRDVPDAENTALVIAQIDAGMRTGNRGMAATSQKSPAERASETQPDVQIDPAIQAGLRAELNRLAPEVKLALSLAGMKDGRFPFSLAQDGISTQINSQEARQVEHLLQQEMFRRLRDGDVEGACEAARAMLVVARSVGDEPTIISMLVRIACASAAAGNLERILAQGEPTESSLAVLQKMVEEEAAFPYLKVGFRGERGMLHLTMKAIEDGKLTASGLTVMSGNATQGFSPFEKIWDPIYSRSAARTAHPELLRRLAEYIEIADLPAPDRDVQMRIKEQELKSGNVPHFVRLLCPACAKVTDADTRAHAFLRAAAAAVAAERFRVANKRWPKELAELTPTYLKTVPLDPYDGKPLRMRATEEGLIIYALGSDLKDNGGKRDPTLPFRPGDNIAFRLWNVAERRKPARNPDVGPPLLTEEELQDLLNPEWLQQNPMIPDWLPPMEKPKAP